MIFDNKITIDYDVKTDILEGEVIQQVVKYWDSYTEAYTMISNQLYATKDKQLQEALIKLGWTPPKEKE